MILAIQFPIADLRSFFESSSRLSKPSWPLAEPDTQFIRFFGGIRARTAGGLVGWAGENESVLCIADNALTFNKSLSLNNDQLGLNLILRRAFTNFYFDGTAVGKFEVGVASKTRHNVDLTQMQFRAVVTHFLKLPVSICNPLGQPNSQELAQAGRSIAQLYFIASTEKWQKAIDKTLRDTVHPGTPLLYLEYDPEDSIEIPQAAKLVSLPEEYGFTLYRYILLHKGVRINTWVVCYSAKSDRERARTLRLYLLRLHAEYECLRIVLRNILERNINPSPRSEISDRLQHYLNKATHNISNLEHKCENQFAPELPYIARDITSKIRSGDLDELLGIIKDLDLRGNIARKTVEFIREDRNTVSPNINIFYSDRRVTTGGGTYIEGNASTNSGDFIGRDQIVKDNKVSRNRNVGKVEENSLRITVDSKLEQTPQKILQKDTDDQELAHTALVEMSVNEESKSSFIGDNSLKSQPSGSLSETIVLPSLNRTIFANLRNVLVSLYSDERSIRRIVDDSGIGLAHIEIDAHTKNNWHSILTEAYKNNQVDALLSVVESEYGGNKELRSICDAYRKWQSNEVISASQPLVGEPKSAYNQNEALDSDHEPRTQENQSKTKPIVKPPQSPITFDWVRVEAGEFIMGLDRSEGSEASDWERPRSQLFLPEFWIARAAITVTQFAYFARATGYKTTAEVSGKSYVSTGSKLTWIQGAYWEQPYGPGSTVMQKGDHPVTCISWYDAVVFCQWAGLRLPSEAEWEKAARGKTGCLYPWGNSAPNRGLCNFNANARDTLPVGSFPDGVSPYQVLDMAGNVWEWTCSLWGTEPSAPQFRYPYRQDDGRENLQAPASFLRVVRGGSWDSRVAAMRTTFRGRFDPTWPCNHIGFRVVWSSVP